METIGEFGLGFAVGGGLAIAAAAVLGVIFVAIWIGRGSH